MLRTHKYLLIALAPVTLALAQDHDASPPSSNLKIDETRSEEDRIQLLLNAAQAYISEQDLESAITAYERVLKIDPKNMQVRSVLSTVFLNAKKYKKAESMLLALIEEIPEDSSPWNNLAWLYATAGDFSLRNGKKAVKYAHEAMTLTPLAWQIWNTLSEAHYVSGEYEKAYRAAMNMTRLVERFESNVTEKEITDNNEQLRKCRRAMETAKSMPRAQNAAAE